MSDVSDKMIDNFKYMSIETLEDIAKGKSDDYEPEAIKVAKQILKDKKQKAKANKPKIKIENSNQDVIVKDINMTFTSMVIFMVKWVIASIPAMIILFILGFALASFIGVGVVSLFK